MDYRFRLIDILDALRRVRIRGAAAAGRGRKPGPGGPDRRGQVRLDVSRPGPVHPRTEGYGDRGSRSRACDERVPQCRLERCAHCRNRVHGRRHCTRRTCGCRRGGRSHRRSRRRHRARARGHRLGEARRHGQRRRGCARRPLDRRRSGRGGCRVHDGLRRSARAHLRNGGVGTLLRLRRRGRGQGHQSTCPPTMLLPPTRSGTTTG